MLDDSEQRRQAIDPNRSFIVQAPAGSGKTELLTQRYLCLLAKVTTPEQVIALTFTRKAAAEMHERIVLAIAHAASGLKAESAHQETTNLFAKAVLAQSERLNWQILEQSSRLKIMTIDSLCHNLTRAIPLYEQQVPFANISEQPESLYREAAKATIRYALESESLHESIRAILIHLDNRQDKLEQMFCDLLASRQLWLEPLFRAKVQTRSDYEQALSKIEKHHIERLFQQVPIHCKEELRYLASSIASLDLSLESPRYPLKNWDDFTKFNRDIAQALATLLLTTTGEFRKSFDHHVGLSRSNCEKDLYDSLKSRSKILLAELANHKEFLLLLKLVSTLPLPQYDEEQWLVLQALLTLVPLLLAHLQLEFRKKAEVDFTSIAEQALQALGSDEEPTDLSLYLDSNIHHLLVDEFQDTSISQFQLLTKLTTGWLPSEGKTLFLVGDPMQSIYRFRQAEVGLFLKVQQQGFGNLSLSPLYLSTNFRSSAVIIDWISKTFTSIFPKVPDIEAGAVNFHPSVAGREFSESSGIYAKVFSSKSEEAQTIVSLVQKELQNSEKTIAILVRSRQQLSALIPFLRAAGIVFQGTEIEKLGTVSHVRDVWCIAKALILPTDRLSWLSFLRSPWGGLNLQDLHALANYDQKKSIYHALENIDNILGLSQEGMQRAKFIFQIMHQALETREQQTLIESLEELMQNLHAKAILSKTEYEDIEQLFRILDSSVEDGKLLDVQLFEKKLETCYSSRQSASNLHIMTIHKSKGLEFDTIILPGLGSKMVNQDKPLLRWLKLLSSSGKETVLLSPINAADNASCPLYSYLGSIDKEKERYEQQRLLYVAATRAKKNLYLFDYHESPNAYSFRELLEGVEFHKENIEGFTEILQEKFLTRLPVNFYKNPPKKYKISRSKAIHIPEKPYARIIGVISHELLQWICTYHPNSLEEIPWNIFYSRFLEHGLSTEIAELSLENLKKQIQNLYFNPIGRWICQKHEQETSEYALLINEDSKISTKIIDRSFYDNEAYWIIDFKTGKETEDSKCSHYEQVNEYARILSKSEQKPLKCGIFYLETCSWFSWDYEKITEISA